MPIYMNITGNQAAQGGGGGLGAWTWSVPLVGLANRGSEVQSFSEEPPFSPDQVDRAAASLAGFIGSLPEDERAVIVHVLEQAAGAAS